MPPVTFSMSTQFINTSHGMIYSPSSVPVSGVHSIQQLKEAGIKYIRVQWVDLTNVIRLRVVPISYFEKLMQCPRPGFGVSRGSMGLVDITMAEGFGPLGEYLYVPDLSTTRICPYAPGHASVLGWFEEKASYKGFDGALTVQAELCPRTKLNNIVKEAKGAGVEFLVGFESEFILLKSTDPVIPASSHQCSGTRGLLSGSLEALILEEIVDSLTGSGIVVEMYHPEGAPGQYEVTTAPLPPLEAADALIHTRETITNITAKHSFHATFAPRITMTSVGNGLHAHISVHSPSNQKPFDTLSELESSFLAGVLDDLPALQALTLPIPASFKRVGDGVWSGGTYVAWGTEHRECPVRLSNATSPASRNFEMRFIDPTANPYLALAGIIGLGYAGIKSQRHLSVLNFTESTSPAFVSEEERQAFGIKQRLPLTWEESRNGLAQSVALRDVLGNEFVETYLHVNKTLGDFLSADDNDDQKALTRLVKFY